jgi:LytS/YehU family sensor histidine kinase
LQISENHWFSEIFDTTHYLRFLFQVELPGAIKSFSIWILLGSAFFFYTIWRQAIEREQQLREENLKYKYKNLKTQVNTHFLFNSLNTLSEIIYADTKKADNYIQKLSEIYRYILEHEETDWIPLNEELAFVNQYFELQKEREDDKIRLDIDFQNLKQKIEIYTVTLGRVF